MFSIQQSFNKAAKSYDSVAVLQKEIATRLMAKLRIINADAKIILDLGAGTGISSKILQDNLPNSNIIALDIAKETLIINRNNINGIKQICADAYKIPFKDNSIDIIFSNLMLQWCFNLDKLFQELQRVLSANGLFIFSTFGPDTLSELKYSWQQIDNSNHVNQFNDMHTIGDMLLTNKFLSPVMEMEYITLTYKKVKHLMLDLKQLGANNIHNPNKNLTGKNKFQKMLQEYEKFRINDKIPATYEVIYGHAWNKANQNHKNISVDNI